MTEGWVWLPHHMGMFTLVNPVGRQICDVAFRSDISEGARDKLMKRLINLLNEPEPEE